MNCRGFMREELAAGLGMGRRSAAGRDHGRDCEPCRDWIRRQRLIDRSLLDIRHSPAPTVNVVARVSEELSRAPSRHAPAERWSLIALPLMGLGLVLGLWHSGIHLQPLLETTLRALLLGQRLAEQLWSPLAALLRAAGRLCLTLLTAVSGVLDSLATLELWFVGTAALCTLMMATSVTLVVGRDIGRHRLQREERH